MAEPTVSVVLPCYNAHEHLGQAIDSMRAQTFRDFEIIVVDDGSTDPETRAFLDGLDGDVRVVRQENRGLPGARNAGFREARGSYVLPLDCDDWLEPTFLEKTLAALGNAPDATFAFTHIALEGEATGVLDKNFNFFEQLFLNQLPYCLLIPKAVWHEAGGYDETMRHGYEDWEFNIRLGGRGIRGVVLPEPLFHYRVSGSGMLKSVSSDRHGQLWREIQQRNAALYRLPALVRSWWRWRRRPSTYPLVLYFGWLAVFKLLPNVVFAALFDRIQAFSHSRRVAGRGNAQ
jgi:glycosyltransferase involved in cell wall biosynthesis